MTSRELSRSLRIASAIMGLVFLFGLAVQYNDPDALRWIAIWGAAAVASLLAARGSVPPILPGIVCAVAVVWSATLLPGVIGRVAPAEMFEQFEMESRLIEQAREGFGLLIIAVWMIVLFIAARKRLASK